MIYNENGIILNEDYILLEYINHNYLENILNESEFTDKLKQGAIELRDKLILAAEGILKWVKEFPSREIIKKNKKHIQFILDDDMKAYDKVQYNIQRFDDGKVYTKDYDIKYFIKIKNEIAPYVLSKGFNHWIENFRDTVNKLLNNNLSENEIESKLYGGDTNNKDEWFTSKNDKKVIIGSKIDSDMIINSALNIQNSIKSLQNIYNDLKKMFRDDPNKYNYNALKILYSYFINAIRSFRNFSTACVKVCMSVINKGESGIYKASKYYSTSRKFKIKEINS